MVCGGGLADWLEKWSWSEVAVAELEVAVAREELHGRWVEPAEMAVAREELGCWVELGCEILCEELGRWVELGCEIFGEELGRDFELGCEILDDELGRRVKLGCELLGEELSRSVSKPNRQDLPPELLERLRSDLISVK